MPDVASSTQRHHARMHRARAQKQASVACDQYYCRVLKELFLPQADKRASSRFVQLVRHEAHSSHQTPPLLRLAHREVEFDEF